MLPANDMQWVWRDSVGLMWRYIIIIIITTTIIHDYSLGTIWLLYVMMLLCLCEEMLSNAGNPIPCPHSQMHLAGDVCRRGEHEGVMTFAYINIYMCMNISRRLYGTDSSQSMGLPVCIMAESRWSLFYWLCHQTKTMYQLLCFKSKFHNHFAFTLGRFMLFLVYLINVDFDCS